MPEAERTARACEAWTREVMRRLEGERLNVITLKWFGRPRQVPSFLERHGVSGVFAADSAFLRGLGIALGLEPVDAPETDDPVADLRGRVALARERLDAGDTFVFCHQKTTDAAGHTKDPARQARHDRGARRGARRPARPTARSSASPATTRRRPRRT